MNENSKVIPFRNRSLEDIDYPSSRKEKKKKNLVIPMPIERILRHWNNCDGLRKIIIPDTTVVNGKKVIERPTKTLENAVSNLRKLRRGEMFGYTEYADKERPFTVEETILAINRFSDAVTNPRSFPRNKEPYKKMDINAFLYNDFAASGNRSCFIRYLEEGAKIRPEAIDEIPEELFPRMTDALKEQFKRFFLHDGEYSKQEEIWFATLSNKLWLFWGEKIKANLFVIDILSEGAFVFRFFTCLKDWAKYSQKEITVQTLTQDWIIKKFQRYLCSCGVLDDLEWIDETEKGLRNEEISPEVKKLYEEKEPDRGFDLLDEDPWTEEDSRAFLEDPSRGWTDQDRAEAWKWNEEKVDREREISFEENKYDP